jgi:hypothetical protein
VLCDQDSETITHLFVARPFTRDVWFSLLNRWGAGQRAPSGTEHSLADWWATA